MTQSFQPTSGNRFAGAREREALYQQFKQFPDITKAHLLEVANARPEKRTVLSYKLATYNPPHYTDKDFGKLHRTMEKLKRQVREFAGEKRKAAQEKLADIQAAVARVVNEYKISQLLSGNNPG